MSKLNDDSVISFGKHKGKTLGEVPDEWLMWYYKENRALMNYVRESIDSKRLK